MANHGCKEIQQSQELGEVSETGHCKDKKRDHGRLRPQLESINQSPPNLMKSVQTNAVFSFSKVCYESFPQEILLAAFSRICTACHLTPANAKLS
jgi:hypothetical protein